MRKRELEPNIQLNKAKSYTKKINETKHCNLKVFQRLIIVHQPFTIKKNLQQGNKVTVTINREISNKEIKLYPLLFLLLPFCLLSLHLCIQPHFHLAKIGMSILQGLKLFQFFPTPFLRFLQGQFGDFFIICFVQFLTLQPSQAIRGIRSDNILLSNFPCLETSCAIPPSLFSKSSKYCEPLAYEFQD